MLRKLAAITAAVIVASGCGLGLAWAASTASTATNVSCATATATLPAHTVGVDGTAVDTISGTSTTAMQCNTQTYTVPTSTVTVTSTPSSTTSTSSRTATTTASTTTTTSSTSPPTGAVVPAAPIGVTAPSGGWTVEYADAFGSCLTDTATKCSAGYARADNTLQSITHANGDGNSNEIAAFEPGYNDVTTAGLDEQCRAVANLGDSYSCGAVNGLASGAFHWNPGASTHVVIQFSAKMPANEGNMDPAVWATGTSYAWEIDFPELWGWNHYPTAGVSNTWCGFGFPAPAVPQDSGGPTGEVDDTFCQTAGANIDPSSGFHTYTFDESGDTFSLYIDGVKVGSKTYSGFNGAAGKLIVQNDLRADKTSGLRTDSHFPAAGNDMTVRYLSVYEPTSANGAGTNGPIVASGTSIAP